MTQIKEIPCTKIQPGPNDRRVFDTEALRELAFSININGLAQPITVRPLGKCFEIVAGERRFRALGLLGWETVPCIVRDLDDEAASAIMLVENTGREDLNAMEEARAYETRVSKYDWSHDRIGEVAGVSAGTVRARLSLLSLREEIQLLVEHGHLPVGHAEALAKLDRDRQLSALRIFQESKNAMPLHTFSGVCAQLHDEQNQDALFDLEQFFLTTVAAGADLPRRGKRAVIDVPRRSDLPVVEALRHSQNGNSVSRVIEDYIETLQTSGFEAEAGVVGTLYSALVKLNYMAVPEFRQVKEEGNG